MTSRANTNREQRQRSTQPQQLPPSQIGHHPQPQHHRLPQQLSPSANGHHPQPQPQHHSPQQLPASANGHHPQPQHHRPLPPQHQPHHHLYPAHYRSSSASLRGCCCCLFLLFSFLALLVVAVVLVVILAVKPKKPQFDLEQVGIQYMGITTPNNPAIPASTNMPIATGDPSTPSASLSLSIRMLFTAVNPNKVGIKYGESRFTVMYKGIPLGRATVPGFFQEAHSVRQVEATISVDRVNLLQADAADLIRDASLNDRVELRVLGDVGAKIRVMNFDSPGVEVSVDCAIVVSPSKQSLTYKQCGFDGLSV